MRLYEVLTGEVVRIWAEDEDQMWKKLEKGEYEFVETRSELQYVGGSVVEFETKVQ